MKFSFIIPTHRRPRQLKRLLLSLHYLSLSDFEVVLVGNDSGDGYVNSTALLARDKFFITPCVADRRGVNYARNYGIEKASGDILVFIDDDCFFGPQHSGFLNTLNAIFSRQPHLSVVGGEYELASKKVSVAGKAYHISAQNWLAKGRLLGPNNWCLLGGCLAVKKEIFNNYKFNNSIVFGGSESEFLLRCLTGGVKMLSTQEISIFHDHHMTPKILLAKAQAQSQTRSNFPIFLKPCFRLPGYIDFKWELIQNVSRKPVEQARVLQLVRAYESQFEF